VIEAGFPAASDGDFAGVRAIAEEVRGASIAALCRTREEDVERAWEEEIQRRIAHIDSGNAKGRPWEDIKRDFASRYGR